MDDETRRGLNVGTEPEVHVILVDPIRMVTIEKEKATKDKELTKGRTMHYSLRNHRMRESRSLQWVLLLTDDALVGLDNADGSSAVWRGTVKSINH